MNNTQLTKGIMLEIEKAMCEVLFDMSYAEFIADAVDVAGDDWMFIKHDNLIDNAIDWLNMEALTAWVSMQNGALEALANEPLVALSIADTLRKNKAAIREQANVPDYIWSK